MSQSFEGAQPQVVRGKHKYRGTKDGMMYPPIPEEEEGRPALNIMYDKRVFRGNTHNQNILKSNLTPAQKEEQRIKEERERKKIEMIKSQLLEFKKSKNTTSPYDLRPGPPARIEVDLTYFLTEQGKSKPEEAEVKLQTDVFQPKPATPPYVPKKTGIDKITQIEDYDLFNYDEEVQPILNVLLSKSVDQAILEVEEEQEIDSIRKFKYEFHKRKQIEDSDWQMEVKREISRIKIKNKALENARLKRKQQIETMNKLQCMNIAKSFLANNFKSSMQFLADKNHWRDTFKDQLNVDFKEWMYQSISQNMDNKSKAGAFKDGICDEQLTKIGTAKDPIKRRVQFNLEKKEKFRMIESKDKRIVHFMFNPNVPVTISPFARKYKRFLDGTLSDFTANEKQAFEAYIQKMIGEELEEGDKNPVVYEDMPYHNFSLSGMNRICFSTADDPFYKATVSKYYPECVVFDANGEILGRVNPMNQKNDEFQMTYCEDFRDSALKINDDRKIQIHLGGITQPGTMILLVVKEYDTSDKTVAEGAYDRAWFRLANEDTNQTLDYNIISKIEKPEEYNPIIPAEDEEDGGAPAKRNDLTYIHGRLWLDDNKKWVFESYKDCFQKKDYADIVQSMSKLYAQANAEHNDRHKALEDANNAVKRSNEEKRLAALEAAKKAKGKKKGKAKVEEEVPAQEASASPDTPINQEKQFDLQSQTEFVSALQHRIGRPFLFGPVEFEGLNDSEDFDYEAAREHVLSVLNRSPAMPQNTCIHGFNVLVKKRNLKRRSSLLKHSRFLRNLEVTTNMPPVKEQPKGEGEGEEEED